MKLQKKCHCNVNTLLMPKLGVVLATNCHLTVNLLDMKKV